MNENRNASHLCITVQLAMPRSFLEPFKTHIASIYSHTIQSSLRLVLYIRDVELRFQAFSYVGLSSESGSPGFVLPSEGLATVRFPGVICRTTGSAHSFLPVIREGL